MSEHIFFSLKTYYRIKHVFSQQMQNHELYFNEYTAVLGTLSLLMEPDAILNKTEQNIN